MKQRKTIRFAPGSNKAFLTDQPNKPAAYLLMLRDCAEAKKPVSGVWVCFTRQQLQAMGENPPKGFKRTYQTATADDGTSAIIVTQEPQN